MNATAPPKLDRTAGLWMAAVPPTGSLIDGKYRVENVIGQGGMSIVMAARHEAVGHRVAIKLLLPTRTTDPSFARRVLREARAAGALRSEHATRVLDVGELDSGLPYLVMELLEGVDFGRLLRERGPLRLRDAATYLVQACDAIAEAHARGIIHRDLKPSNLFLARRPDGTALTKLMDFGVSKLMDASPDDALTATGDNLGTPHYMSPEQLLCSRDVDARTDVWALGVLLYRLLTGAHPFDGSSAAAVHVAIATSPAPKLRDARPDAPPELEALVQRCLTKPRDRRLRTAAEFASVLLPLSAPETQRRYGRGGSLSTGTAARGSLASRASAGSSGLWIDALPARPARRRMHRAAWKVAGSVLVAFSLSGAVIAVTSALEGHRARVTEVGARPSRAPAPLPRREPMVSSPEDPPPAPRQPPASASTNLPAGPADRSSPRGLPTGKTTPASQPRVDPYESRR